MGWIRKTNTMNKFLFQKKSFFFVLLTNLTFWVLISIIIGVLLGHYNPERAIEMKIVGDTFISIIKWFIAPIIFLTIVLGISGMGDLKKVGRIGLKSLIYFEIVSSFALVIGIVVALLIEPGKIDMAGLSIQDPSQYTNSKPTDFNWLDFFFDNITLQVLLVAIITGIVLNYSKKREVIVAFLQKCSKVVFTLLKWVMYLAPLGAFGGMAYTVGKFGHSIKLFRKILRSLRA